jgi:hypothetical protein
MDMANPAASPHGIVTRRVPSDRPGFVRLETYDTRGLVSVVDVRDECDSPDLRLFMREYHEQHPRAADAARVLYRMK